MAFLLSFALELYFKCLLQLSKKPIPRSHVLGKIFKQLGPGDAFPLLRESRNHSRL
jgi:HEPN domain-containing protein